MKHIWGSLYIIFLNEKWKIINYFLRHAGLLKYNFLGTKKIKNVYIIINQKIMFILLFILLDTHVELIIYNIFGTKNGKS